MKTLLIQCPLLFIILFIQNVLALDLGVCGNLEAKIDQNAKILHEILGKLTAGNYMFHLCLNNICIVSVCLPVKKLFIYII